MLEIFSSQAPKFGNFQFTSPQIWKLYVHKVIRTFHTRSFSYPVFFIPGLFHTRALSGTRLSAQMCVWGARCVCVCVWFIHAISVETTVLPVVMYRCVGGGGSHVYASYCVKTRVGLLISWCCGRYSVKSINCEARGRHGNTCWVYTLALHGRE